MLALISALLLAQEVPTPVHVGDWLVGAMDSSSCQAEAHFADHYLLNISEDSGGTGHFLFADDRLVLKDGDSKPATYSWDGWKTSHEGMLSAVASGGKSFLVMDTGPGFTEEMAGAKGLWLRVPGVDFDDDFAIPNAMEIVSAIASCNLQH